MKVRGCDVYSSLYSIDDFTFSECKKLESIGSTPASIERICVNALLNLKSRDL